ncbi:class I SAM-dependent methyltransferase [Pyramidobacter sp.]|uniref:class I SAM-dependent methyltransferase n=1 Tax=Pyramidobacter sp. TaxID=1943581 RepID=UPI0025EB8C89|nr:class I SAM-dependent methyltransferase [Pyramidobacter sp.]MCI7403422.1 class I SAM-dependent methyltransferase [Pyramidobacter sp.]MDY3211577.1 class I SAM-dependent methyltransferase [Pyramidobacter sp.]
MDLKLRELEGTALITVVARARASQNPDEDFYDPWAEEIVGNLTPEQIKSVETGRVNAGVLVRELAFDAAVAKILKEKPQGVVANLGAGLDSRPFRLGDLAARWYDYDLPDGIAARRSVYAEDAAHHFVAADVLQPEFVELLPPRVDLFYACGVLMYLKADALNEMFARLARHSPGAAVLFDTATPFFARHAHRIVRGVKPGLFGGWGFKYDARPEQVKALFPVLGDIEVSNYGDSGLLRRLHGSMKLFFRLLRPVFTDSLFVTARLGERPLFF